MEENINSSEKTNGAFPSQRHFNSVNELKESFSKTIENYELPFEQNDGNNPIFNPPKDSFEIVINKEGYKVLLPCINKYPYLFRGQGKEYNPCYPSLYRNSRPRIDLFIERLRYIEFVELLKTHPIIQDYFIPNNYSIDYLGLAQHYGLQTEVLDLTNDIDIALFFAMCPYDRENDRYTYLTDDDEHIGILYIVNPIISESIKDGDISFFNGKISVIGLQPFERPGAQRGFSIHLKINENFNGIKYTFRYSKKESLFYYNKYDKGEKLWVKDILADKVKNIAKKTKFHTDIFKLAHKLYPMGKNTAKNVKRKINDLGISISKNNLITKFSDEERKNIKKYWETKQSTIFEKSLVKRSYYEFIEESEIENQKNVHKINMPDGKVSYAIEHEFMTLEGIKGIEMIRLSNAATKHSSDKIETLKE